MALGLPFSSTIAKVLNLEVVKTDLVIAVVINLRPQLIVFKCMVCCIHGAFIIAVHIITDIGRSYFDKGGRLPLPSLSSLLSSSSSLVGRKFNVGSLSPSSSKYHNGNLLFCHSLHYSLCQRLHDRDQMACKQLGWLPLSWVAPLDAKAEWSAMFRALCCQKNFTSQVFGTTVLTIISILAPSPAFLATLVPISKGLGFFVAIIGKNVYCSCRFSKNES